MWLGGLRSFPFSFPSFSFSPFSSPLSVPSSFFSLPLLFLLLYVGSPKSSWGLWASAVSSPSEVWGQSPDRNQIWRILALKYEIRCWWQQFWLGLFSWESTEQIWVFRERTRKGYVYCACAAELTTNSHNIEKRCAWNITDPRVARISRHQTWKCRQKAEKYSNRFSIGLS